jgi:hypothetical protein
LVPDVAVDTRFLRSRENLKTRWKQLYNYEREDEAHFSGPQHFAVRLFQMDRFDEMQEFR